MTLQSADQHNGKYSLSNLPVSIPSNIDIIAYVDLKIHFSRQRYQDVRDITDTILCYKSNLSDNNGITTIMYIIVNSAATLMPASHNVHTNVCHDNGILATCTQNLPMSSKK